MTRKAARARDKIAKHAHLEALGSCQCVACLAKTEINLGKAADNSWISRAKNWRHDNK